MLPVLVPVTHSAPAIPVIGYHAFDEGPEFAGGPRYDVHGLNIPTKVFRQQLESMYAKGFWPVNLSVAAQGRTAVPAGKHPIVLTFDDGRSSQFRYLPNGKVDPNSAVGVMLAFHHQHPEWPLRGTFYLIAGSDANGVPFDQEGLERSKVRALLAWGFEVGNHSLTHPSFRDLTPRQIVRQLSETDRYLKRLVPGISLKTFALPYGQLPRRREDWPLLWDSPRGVHPYHHLAVALFDNTLWRPAAGSKARFLLINRIAPAPGVVEHVLDQESPKGSDRRP